MLLDFALPEHDRKLIPEGRRSGTMPWVIAIMLFLTLLAAAAGLIIADAARQGGDDLARRVTVQVIEADPAIRASRAAQVVKQLRTVEGVEQVSPVSEAKVRKLLEPWLGSEVIDADIPVPALVDVQFSRVPEQAMLDRLKTRLKKYGADIRIDSHAAWMAPFFNLMSTLLWLSVAILFLLLAATSITVVLAVRSALNTHRQTIEIMHMMGGTDLQAARLFQRRMALDALLGGLIGFSGAALVILLLAGRFRDVEPGLFAGAAMPWYGWILLALIPLAVTGIAMLMARWTVLSALKKML